MSALEPEKFGEWTLDLDEVESPPGPFLRLRESRIGLFGADQMQIWNESLDFSFSIYPPIVAIERLLALRRAALAPEAQAPSGEPWRPEVGEKCLYYNSGDWLELTRLPDLGPVQRFESCVHEVECDAAYDGIRPLGSLPMPPSCGGETEAWERQEPVAAPSPAAWGAAFEALGRESENLDSADQAVATRLVDRPVVASERLALARLLEWARAKWTAEAADMKEYPERGRDAFEECVDEIEREIAALGPPSIAEDLRTPEPGAFDGAELVSGDGSGEALPAFDPGTVREGGPVFVGDQPTLAGARKALLAEGLDLNEWAPIHDFANAAVREALVELRGELESNSSSLSAGLRFAIDALDRLAERFK